MILQGSVVTQTVLDGLTAYPPVVNFL